MRLFRTLPLLLSVFALAGCAADPGEESAESSADALGVPAKCTGLAAKHVASANDKCEITACEEGYGNHVWANAYESVRLTPAQQAADGCEVALKTPLVTKHLGSIAGDLGWNANIDKDYARYTGTGDADLTIRVTEGLGIHDMNVSVSLWHDPNVRYDLEVIGPGTCRDPQNKKGIRAGGIAFGGGSSSVATNVDLTWPERVVRDDSAEIKVKVRFKGGSTARSNGRFTVFVGSTDYRVSIDHVPELCPEKDKDNPFACPDGVHKEEDPAKPSLACTL